MSNRPTAVARAIGAMLLALTFLIVLDASGKWLGARGVPVAATSWSRYFGHLLLVLLVYLPQRGSLLFATAHPTRQLVRGALMVIVTLLYFAALKVMPLAQATAVFFLAPILVTILARLLLRERAGWPAWLAVGGGFLGVLVVVRPSANLPLAGVLLAVAAAACNASYQVLTRAQTGSDDAATQLLYSALVGAVILSATLPWWWQPLTMLDAFGWGVFALLGALGALGHWMLIAAYRAAPAPQIAPWMYMQLLLSVAIGYLAFGETPDTVALLGMALIAASPNLARLQPRPAAAAQVR